MLHAELLQHSASDSPEVGDDSHLSLSSKSVRVPSRRLFATACDASEGEQINGLFDAIHWAKWKLGTDADVTYSIMSGSSTEKALDALSTLMSALPAHHSVRLHQDLEPVRPSLPFLDADSSRRIEQLRSREQFVLPAIHERIRQQIGDASFGWVRTLTGKTWTGRVDGLMVCRLDDHGGGSIQIGNSSRRPIDDPIRERFRYLTGGDSYSVTPDNLPAATSILERLATDRRKGILNECQLEHLLEGRVLRGAVPVEIHGKNVDPISWQFPTRWSEFGSVRYIDVLGRIGDVPWVVELKVREGGGAGSYFRHAVAQAILYREFTRIEHRLAIRFNQEGLSPIDRMIHGVGSDREVTNLNRLV